MAFEGLSSKLSSALSKLTSRGKLTEQAVKEGMRDVRMALLEADVNYLVVKDFCKKVTERCVGQQVLDSLSPAQQVMKIVSEEMTALMGSEHARLTWSSSVPTIYMLCGLQGAGKTTMAGKLANYLQKQGKKPLLAACDIYRPAAIKQLQVVGSQVNVPVYEHGTQDPVKTAQEAIEQCRQALNNMALEAKANLEDAYYLIGNYSEKQFQFVAQREDVIDKYEDKLGSYLIKLTGKELTEQQNLDVTKFLHTIGDMERIGDHAMNIAECAKEIHEKSIVFSEGAERELKTMFAAVQEITYNAITAFITNDLELAYRIEPLEELIDSLCDEMKLHHVDRLQRGICKLSQGFVFNDLLTNYERVADHCSNIAVAMIELESDSFDTHQYLISLKDVRSHSFDQYYEEYRKKFALPDD